MTHKPIALHVLLCIHIGIDMDKTFMTSVSYKNAMEKWEIDGCIENGNITDKGSAMILKLCNTNLITRYE